MKLLAVYDTDVSANGLKYHKVMLHLISISRPQNAMVPLMVLSRSLDVDTCAVASNDSNTNAGGIL